MGTNYYHAKDPCPTCGRGDSDHVGKSSVGWTFGFHATETERSCEAWLARIAAGGKLTDEYGRTVTYEEFKALVDSKRTAKLNHTREHPEGNFFDADGCSFSDGEFS